MGEDADELRSHSDKELKLFRDEARTWLDQNVPSEPRPPHGPEVRAFDAEWQRRQYDGGWAGIDWEIEHGGRGLSLIKQIIWYEELVNAGAPTETCFGVALGHAGPTIIMRGDEEQKRFYLPQILRGETPWCQGFSEPGAGSDLANLRTRGRIEDGHLIVTGQKIWTTWGHWADYGELLVRTESQGSRHGGLTWVVVDMHSPGVDIREIPQIDLQAEFCEVFYDDVRIPLDAVVGGIGNGWSVAMSTLGAERGTAFLNSRLADIRLVDDLIEHARARDLLANEAVAERLAVLRAEATAIRSMAYLQVSSARPDGTPGPESTAVRTFYVQLQQRIARAAIDLLGQDAIAWNPWVQHWLTEFAATIAGGTKDIQKNIIGERVLGLPR